MTQNFPIIYQSWLASNGYTAYCARCTAKSITPVSEGVYDLFIEALDVHHNETSQIN